MARVFDHAFGISTVDAVYERELQTSVHVVVEDGHAVVIDTATAPAVPRILAALAARGVPPQAVDYVMLTHVHLDHAGGAGQLLARCPGARLTVHPRGARHMIDPSRLLAATVAIYGEAATRKTYGEVLPAPAERVLETPEGFQLAWRSREFLFLDTPGHARHHCVIRDSLSGHVFAGDCFGLSYRELDRDGRPFAIPTTSPSQFDPPALHRSIERIVALRPDAVYVAHFGQVREVPRLAGDLHRLIDAHAELARRAGARDAGRIERLKAGIAEIFLEERVRQDWRITPDALLALLALDIELNAQGLAAWMDAHPA